MDELDIKQTLVRYAKRMKTVFAFTELISSYKGTNEVKLLAGLHDILLNLLKSDADSFDKFDWFISLNITKLVKNPELLPYLEEYVESKKLIRQLTGQTDSDEILNLNILKDE